MGGDFDDESPLEQIVTDLCCERIDRPWEATRPNRLVETLGRRCRSQLDILGRSAADHYLALVLSLMCIMFKINAI